MKRKIIITTLIFIILFLIILSVYKFSKPKTQIIENKANVVNRIDNFDYTLDDRDTNIFKKEFEKLENILAEEEINYDEYAISLAKLYIIDFYTLNNKINKYDVGSLEFVDSRIVENFKVKAIDTIYKYIEDNTNKKRNQELPEVKTITSAENENTTYTIDNKAEDAIKVIITWNYVKELGYDSKGEITFIRDNQKLVIVNYQAI